MLALPLLLLPMGSTFARNSRSPGRAVDAVVAVAFAGDVAAGVAAAVVAVAVVDALDGRRGDVVCC